MNSKEVGCLLAEAGWIEIAPRTFRNHRHYRHPARGCGITVPEHEDIPEMTLKRIAHTAGISLTLGQLALLEEK